MQYIERKWSIIYSLDNTTDQPSKCRTKNWVDVSNKVRGSYDVNSQVKFKTTMVKSTRCKYSDAYILVKGTITITGAGAEAAKRNADERNKQITLKNCAPFTDCISEITNTQVHNARNWIL